MSERPHICNTLRQLRGWVTLAALCLALACAAQMLVFGFVHYTDIRFAQAEAPAGETPPKVVVAEKVQDDDLFRPASGKGGAHERHATAVHSETSVDPNLLLAPADRVLATVCNVAQSMGVIAAVWLGALCLLSITIAGPALVPGVEKAVTAGIWSIVLCLLCLPWHDVMPSIPFLGIFSSYHVLTAANTAWDAGTRSAAGVMAQHLLLPCIGGLLSLCVLMWHRVGVERGTIMMTALQHEHMLEEEMNHIRSRGVNTASHRTAGALTRVLGEQAAPPIPPTSPTITPTTPHAPYMPGLRVAAGAESMSAPTAGNTANTARPPMPVQGLAPSFARKLGKHNGHPDAGEPERRLI